MRASLALFLIPFVGVLTQTASAANIELLGIKQDNVTHLVVFNGAIRIGDLAQLSRLYEKLGKPRVELLLNSEGGDVEEAMRIGSFLEQNEISVHILPPHICASSCVLIMAGADFKWVEGRIGIHRPYLTDTTLGETQIASYLPKLQQSVKVYLIEKGLLSSLAEDMFSIPPERVKWLSHEELSRYRLNQRNYVKEEQKDIQAARGLGLSRSEYLVRKQKMNDVCSKYKFEYENMSQCINEIMYAK